MTNPVGSLNLRRSYREAHTKLEQATYIIPTVDTDYHSAVCAPQCLHGSLRACAVIRRSKSGAMTGHYDVRHSGGSECFHLFSFVSISFVCSRPFHFSNLLYKRGDPPP